MTPYEAFSTGVMERFHRTLNAMPDRVISETQKYWDEKLPEVIAAYQASRHDAIGFFLNCCMFGRKLRVSIDIVLYCPSGAEYTISDEFVDEIQTSLQESYALAMEQLDRSAEINKHIRYASTAGPVFCRDVGVVLQCSPLRRQNSEVAEKLHRSSSGG